MRQATTIVFVCLVLASQAGADDWPQWMGPTRDGVYAEDGLVDKFPASGLNINWRLPIGGGYAGPAVAGGKVYVMDYTVTSGEIVNDPGSRASLNGSERLLCLDAKTGRELWKYEYDRPYSISYPAGPRATPTVDGDAVYALGAEGDLLALSTDNGTLRWKVNFKEDFQAPTPIWGFASHPLVYQDMVITLVGGEGSAVVAFNKATGEPVWKALSTGDIGYCPPVLLERDGQVQLLVWHSEALCSLNPVDGSVYWQIDLKPQYGMSICRPQIEGNKLFASGIGSTAVMLELSDGTQSPKELWRGKPKMGVYGSNATPILYQGMIFGSDCQEGNLIAAKQIDGERLWSTYEPTSGGERRVSHGTAFLTRQGDRFWLFSETGDLITATLDADGYHEQNRFHVIEPTGDAFGRPVVWVHPAYANKHCYIRNDKEIICVSLDAAAY